MSKESLKHGICFWIGGSVEAVSIELLAIPTPAH
jgi:hypothetical protein